MDPKLPPTTEKADRSKAKSQRRFRRRYSRVLFYFATVLLEMLWWEVVLRRIGLRALVRGTGPRRYLRAAQRFRRIATDLGGVWIKVGQFLSARVDILPESITTELAGLQDEVTPEPFSAMQTVLDPEFDGSWEEHFDWIDPQPLASASLGQVHRARLSDEVQVVVKIQRPQIHQIIEVDLAALRIVVSWLRRYRPIAGRADLDALLAEFSRTLWQEVDYLAEADNARRFAAMFRSDPRIRIPKVYADHTTARVLTLEDVFFIKITDYPAIEAQGISKAEVADRLFHTYLHQIFVEGFFHADPHPGNLFVDPMADGRWRLVFVDFGMVGHITPEVKEGMRDLVIAVGTRDIERLIKAYQTLGVLLPGADLDRIQQAEAAVFERFWGKSMAELRRIHPGEVHQIAREFRDVLYQMPFQIPSDMIFLGRCISILAGMCTGLDPDFNVFKGLTPFAQQLLSEEEGEWLNQVLEWIKEQGQVLLTMPRRVDRVLTRIERGELMVSAKASPSLERQIEGLTKVINRLVGAVIFAALLLVGTFFYISRELILGIIALGLAVITLAWVVLR